jgi:hypothetical protein
MFLEMFFIKIVHHSGLAAPSASTEQETLSKLPVWNCEFINVHQWNLLTVIRYAGQSWFWHLLLFLFLVHSIVMKILFIRSMSAVNAFLFDFIKMRKEMQPGAPPKKASRVKYAKDTQEDSPNHTLANIIEKKPHKREVIEYLQERANAYSAEMMA